MKRGRGERREEEERERSGLLFERAAGCLWLKLPLCNEGQYGSHSIQEMAEDYDNAAIGIVFY